MIIVVSSHSHLEGILEVMTSSKITRVFQTPTSWTRSGIRITFLVGQASTTTLREAVLTTE